MVDTAHRTREAMMTDAELRALFDAAVDAIVVIDERGQIIAFSAAAERLFACTAADVIGKPVDILMPEPHRSNHAGYMRRYLQTGKAGVIGIRRELDAQRSTGEIFPIALSVGDALGHGQHRFVGIIRDLSVERAAETRTRSLETRLAQVGRFNVMGEMATGIAHEINQPLSAIATYAQTAMRVLQGDPAKTAAAIDICKKIEEQAHRAGQVIRNIRKFVRQQEVISGPLDVNRVIADVWNLIEADTRAKDIRAIARYADGLPPVLGDALQLQQVVLNLTHNSVEAMSGRPEANGAVAVETSQGADGRVRITVTDHGPGVSKTLGDSIFHPFVTTKTDGIGIGLAISRSITRACGGDLNFCDNPEGGAIFIIDLQAAGDGDEER